MRESFKKTKVQEYFIAFLPIQKLLCNSKKKYEKMHMIMKKTCKDTHDDVKKKVLCNQKCSQLSFLIRKNVKRWKGDENVLTTAQPCST